MNTKNVGRAVRKSAVNLNGDVDRRKVKLKLPGRQNTSEMKIPPIGSGYINPSKDPMPLRNPKTIYIPSECNFIPEISSEESEPTPLPDHWNEPAVRIKRNRASTSEVQAEPKRADDKQRDSMEEDTDATLPRTFFPLGVDWDSNLEAEGYGGDVVLKSESSSSSDESYDRPNDKVTASDVIMYTKMFTERETLGQSVEGGSSSSEEFIRKRVQMKQEPPSIRFGENWRDDHFLQILETARARRQKEMKEKAKKDKHCIELNHEVRNEGPLIPRKLWRVDDAQPMKVMRKETSQKKSLEDIYEHLKNDERTHFTYSDYIDRLNTTKEELDRLDVTQKVTITDEFLNGFCHTSEVTHTTNLVLQGKEVYNQIGRRIQDFDLPNIFLFLIKRKDITYLDFCYNNLTGNGMRLIADYLKWDQRIIGLNLMNNDIEQFESPVIDSMTENLTLRSLRLNGNPIGKKGGEFLAFVVMFKNLEHLDLGQTDQEVSSLMWITQALINNETLKVLDLSRVIPGLINCHHGSYWIASAKAFSDILRLNSSLVELHIQKNDLSDLCVEELMFGLSFNKTLQLLDLSYNQIRDEGSKLIAKSIGRGAPLRALMLAGNDIGDLGARALAFELPKSQLQLLNIANNRIKDQGIIDIIHCAKKSTPLLAFFCSGNPIGTRALEVVNKSIIGGALMSVQLDVKLYFCEGKINLGRNNAADKYGARYYQTIGNTENDEKNHQRCLISKFGAYNAAYKFQNFSSSTQKPISHQRASYHCLK